MRSTKTSFSARLSFAIVTFTSILFIAAFYVLALSSHNLITKEATNNANSILAATIKEIEGTLIDVESTIRASEWLAKDHINDPSYLEQLTFGIVSEKPDIIGCAIAFAPDYFEDKYYFSPFSYVDPLTGDVALKYLGSEESYDYFNMEWFQRPFSLGQEIWTEPYLDEGGSEHLMTTFSHPIKDEKGKVIAIMTADIGLNWLSDLVSKIKPYDHSYVALFSRNGEYISSGAGSPLQGQSIYTMSKSASDPQIKQMCDSILSGKEGVSHFNAARDRYFVVYGPLRNGWVAALACQHKAILAQAATATSIRMTVTVVVVLPVMMIYPFFQRFFTKGIMIGAVKG